MGEIVIKKFPDLFRDSIEAGKNIKNVDIKKLPQAGYGSIMVKADLTLEDKNGSEEMLHTVVKLLPTDEFVKKIFQIETTYKSEVMFYTTILPTLKNFQKDQGIFPQLSSFAKFYGARLSLDKESVDEDAALVLEDLSVAGFKNINRKEGFDLAGTKVILRDLARLHGTTIALKLLNPQLFEEKVKPFCRDYIFPAEITLINLFKDSLRAQEEYASLADKIGHWPCKIPQPREPYASLSHGDLWVNNTMQRFQDGRIADNVFVDFQAYSYRSCASDVFFFLWSSCQLYVVQNHLDELLKYYHDLLIQTMQELNCDAKQFSFNKFLEELKIESEYEFGHSIFFVFIVKYDSLISENNIKKKTSQEEYMANIPQGVTEFLRFMVKECNKRGWLH